MSEKNERRRDRLARHKNPSSVSRDANAAAQPENGNQSAAVSVIMKTQSTARFSGPLPPPDILSGYEKALPGAAGRIIAMAELQAEHRRKMEQRNLDSDINKSYLGMVCGLIVALCGIFAAKEIVLSGNLITGTVFGFVALGSLVGVFMKAANIRRDAIREIREFENRDTAPPTIQKR